MELIEFGEIYENFLNEVRGVFFTRRGLRNSVKHDFSLWVDSLVTSCDFNLEDFHNMESVEDYLRDYIHRKIYEHEFSRWYHISEHIESAICQMTNELHWEISQYVSNLIENEQEKVLIS